MTRLPQLHAVRVFEAVARLGSFTAAAEELHLTQSAVSHQIKNLEDFFRQPLIDRRRRRLALTPAGETLYDAAQGALMLIAQAARHIQTQGNQIRLKSFPTIGARWLAPQLADFYRRHPGVEVSLTTVWEKEPSFRWDQYDLALQYGHGDWKGQRVDLLHEEVLAPVCVPELLPPGATTMSAEAFARATLIHPTAEREDWTRWLASAGLARDRKAPEQSVDTDYMAIEAALGGAGITIVDPLLVRSELKSGRLIEPLAHRVRSGLGYYLVSSEQQVPSPRTEVFCDWLFAVMRQAEAEIAGQGPR